MRAFGATSLAYFPPPRGGGGAVPLGIVGFSKFARRIACQVYFESRLVLLQFYVGKNRGFNSREVKCIFRQLLEGLDYLHKNDIIHRYIQNAS